MKKRRITICCGRVNTENREAERTALVRYAGALALRLAGKKIVEKTWLSLVLCPMRNLQISDGYNNLAGPLGRGI